MSSELLPCPFCGGEARLARAIGSSVRFASCIACEAFGPSRDTEAEAIAVWNSRRSPAGDIAEGVKLVPVEPTPQMVHATFNDPEEAPEVIESHNARNRRIYRAMLAAAPALSAPPPELPCPLCLQPGHTSWTCPTKPQVSGDGKVVVERLRAWFAAHGDTLLERAADTIDALVREKRAWERERRGWQTSVAEYKALACKLEDRAIAAEAERDTLRTQLERAESELRDIAETEHADCFLDPTRPKRIAASYFASLSPVDGGDEPSTASSETGRP